LTAQNGEVAAVNHRQQPMKTANDQNSSSKKVNFTPRNKEIPKPKF
jgi:hypothetical protein